MTEKFNETAKVGKHYVFVYGTLRYGERLHDMLATAGYLGEYVTVACYYDMMDAGGFPVAVTGGTFRLRGEVYVVDDETLERLDWVERGYSRLPISVDGLDTSVQMYLYGKQDVLPSFLPIEASKYCRAVKDWCYYQSVKDMEAWNGRGYTDT